MKAVKAEMVCGVHPVFETLKSGRRKIEQIHIASGRQDRKVRSILALATQKGIRVTRVPGEVLDRLALGAVLLARRHLAAFDTPTAAAHEQEKANHQA